MGCTVMTNGHATETSTTYLLIACGMVAVMVTAVCCNPKPIRWSDCWIVVYGVCGLPRWHLRWKLADCICLRMRNAMRVRFAHAYMQACVCTCINASLRQCMCHVVGKEKPRRFAAARLGGGRLGYSGQKRTGSVPIMPSVSTKRLPARSICTRRQGMPSRYSISRWYSSASPMPRHS